MVDHISEIPRLVDFSVKCFNCDTTKLYLRNIPAMNEDDSFYKDDSFSNICR